MISAAVDVPSSFRKPAVAAGLRVIARTPMTAKILGPVFGVGLFHNAKIKKQVAPLYWFSPLVGDQTAALTARGNRLAGDCTKTHDGKKNYLYGI